jgi:hypothetical protein
MIGFSFHLRLNLPRQTPTTRSLYRLPLLAHRRPLEEIRKIPTLWRRAEIEHAPDEQSFTLDYGDKRNTSEISLHMVQELEKCPAPRSTHRA